MAAKKKNKKNKKKTQQPGKMTPERYMREKARKLPIGKCYVNSNWQKEGLAEVIVTRNRPDGHITAGFFLVDTFCLGVKNVGYQDDMDAFNFLSFLKQFESDTEVTELSYDEAHNLIYGAISFAEEGGLSPCKDFNIARYILEEDTEDIPLIEYEYGKNGQHFLIMRDQQDKIHFNTLRKKLGDDFEFIDCIDYDEEEDWDEEEEFDEDWDEDWDDDDEEFDENWDENWDEEEEDRCEEKEDSSWSMDEDFLKAVVNRFKQIAEEKEKIPHEPYSYNHPAYPQTLEVQHPFIAEALYSDQYDNCLPDQVVRRILDLPADEAARDLSRIIFYEIGRTYQTIDEKTIDSDHPNVLIHAHLLLTQLGSSEGLEALLEILRQNNAFIEYHLGVWSTETMHKALYACGKDQLPILINFLHQPGLDSIMRDQAVTAMVMIAYQHPERRSEIIEEFRRLLISMETNLPQLYACDGEFAGLVIEHLIEMKAVELIPEIKRLLATGLVYSIFWDDHEQVIRDISDGKKGNESRMEELYGLEDIFEIYESLR